MDFEIKSARWGVDCQWADVLEVVKKKYENGPFIPSPFGNIDAGCDPAEGKKTP